MSAAPARTTATADSAQDPSYPWHGYLLAALNLPPPAIAVRSDDLARPKYTTIKSQEYLDTPDVLNLKADALIRMWSAAHKPLVYAGAGISTAAGINDYASNAKGSVVQAKKMKLTMDNILALKPTVGHRTIAALEQAGFVWGWLQQNHDGLAQKAGFPARKVNELHGSWLDSKANPIIAMSGSLRGDLYEWMLEMEERCDFVFAAGTSFSGLNADRCAATCAARHRKHRVGQGLAVISIQQTPMDGEAALRIFAKIDDFMAIVASKMMLTLDTTVHRYSAPALPVGCIDDATWEAERTAKREAYAAACERRLAKKSPTLPPLVPATKTTAAATTLTVGARARSRSTSC